MGGGGRKGGMGRDMGEGDRKRSKGEAKEPGVRGVRIRKGW